MYPMLTAIATDHMVCAVVVNIGDMSPTVDSNSNNHMLSADVVVSTHWGQWILSAIATDHMVCC